MSRKSLLDTRDVALGSYEAAALLGIHYTRPGRMMASGKLLGRQMQGIRTSPGSAVAVYSSRDCERDYREYDDRVVAAGGKHTRRPRAWLHLRPKAQQRIAAVKQHIDYADACSIYEAMTMLNLVSTAQVCKMLREGKIVGRRPWSGRNDQSKSFWIVSRRSVEEWRKGIIAREKAGTKPGRRKFVTAK